jgi:hypothetical protein
MKNSEYSEHTHLLILLIALLHVISILHFLKAYHKVYYQLMSTEHDEQPIELTYLEETVHTIQLVLYNNSDKENHTPNIQFNEITRLE